MNRIAVPALVSGLLLLACTVMCPPAQAGADGSDPFPAPPALNDAVQFWRQVFGVWRRDQVALHDDTHLGVVYEVLSIPGDVGDSLTAEQRAYVRRQKRLLQERLSGLETSVRESIPLTAAQQRLLAAITRGAGHSAFRGAADRVRSQRGMKERFLHGLEVSGRYDALMRDEFGREGLPEDLAYLPHVESSFVAAARSSAGAVGIWQFTRGAGQRFLRLNRAVDERYDPIFAARGAARYLAHAYDLLGDWGLAITSYNHGLGGMVRAEAEWGADIGRIVRYYQGPLFGFASRNFYAEFLAVRSLATHASKYFPGGVHRAAPLDRDRILLTRSLPAHRLAALCGLSTAELAEINPAWTSRAATGRVPLPAEIEVWVPKGHLPPTRDLLAYAEPIRSGPDSRLAAPDHVGALAERDASASVDEALRVQRDEKAEERDDGLMRVAFKSSASRKSHAGHTRSARAKRTATRHPKHRYHKRHRREVGRREARREASRSAELVAVNEDTRRSESRTTERRAPAGSP